MNNYYQLIKEEIIDFHKLLLEKYRDLGLDEVDYVILIKLYDQLQKGINFLNIDTLAITLSKDKASKKIVRLVNDGFITLEISTQNDNGKEIFSLDELYKKLGYLLEKGIINETEEQKSEMKRLVSELEEAFKKILSPIELQLVNKWVYEYKYGYEIILEALVEAKRERGRGIQYMDRYLFKRNTLSTEPQGDDELRQLFRDVYGKK